MQAGEVNERSSLLSNGTTNPKGTNEDKEKKSKKIEASLFKILAKVYGLDLLKSWACKFIYDLLQFVSPTLLEWVDNIFVNPQLIECI